MYFNFALNLYMTLSSADNPFKQFGIRSAPRHSTLGHQSFTCDRKPFLCNILSAISHFFLNKINLTQDFDTIVSAMWVSHSSRACLCVCEADWQPSCHGVRSSSPAPFQSWNIFYSHSHSFLFKEVQLSLLAKPHSTPFCRSNNQTIGRWEHLGMISLPSPPSINWAIL